MEVEVRGARGVWLLYCTRLDFLNVGRPRDLAFELRVGVNLERGLPLTNCLALRR